MMPPAETARDDWEAFWDTDDAHAGSRRLAVMAVAGAAVVLASATIWLGRLSPRRAAPVAIVPSATDIHVRPPPPR